jgi:thioredoxin-like negative regulator of GroEL
MVLSASMSDAIDDGRLADAIDIQRRIVATDPLSANQRGNLGAFLIAVDHLPEAQAELERALELSPASVSTMTSVADVLLLQGRPDEAFEVVSRMPEGFVRDARRALVSFARGDAREGDEILARLQALTKDPDFDPAIAFAIAEVYAARKDLDRAFEWLGRARPRTKRQVDKGPYWMLLENLRVSPHLKSLHLDPRWDELLEDVRAQPLVTGSGR